MWVTAIDVTDRDINGLEIVGIPRMDVKGRVRVNDPGQETPAHVEFRVIDATDLVPVNSGQGAATKDGALVLRSLAAQRYSVLCSAPFYVESVLADGRELRGGIVDLTHGAPGEIEIVVGWATGQIEGSLHLAGDAAVPDATAVLVSADGRTGNTGARAIEVDANGRFHIGSVPPGRWYVFTVARYDENAWQNMDFVSARAVQGTAATVSDNASPRVEVSLIPDDDLRRAADGVVR
jgi:hypothetical protein